MTELDWDSLPRLLQDLCDGHPGRPAELYRMDYPTGGRAWLCKSCYMRARMALAGTDPAPEETN